MSSAIVTVFGSLNFDILIGMDRLPVPGETRTAESMSFAGGGKGANQAVQAARLGAQVRMVGAVGNDALGQQLLNDLRAYGVDTAHVRVVNEAPTGVGVVSYLSDGSVAATIGRGANYALTMDDVTAAERSFQTSHVAVFQLENPVGLVMAAARAAQRAGCTVILNAAPATNVPEELFEAVDLLVVNEVEAGHFWNNGGPILSSEAERCGRELSLRYGCNVIITLGADGSRVIDRTGASVAVPAAPTTAVETTGAGDSYIGALAVLLAEGESLQRAAQFGAAAAACTIRAVGAQNAMPDRNTLLRTAIGS